jgi:hypothetical protein
MADDPDVPNGIDTTTPEPAPRSIREIAEEAWSDLESQPDDDSNVSRETLDTGHDGRQRDAMGRFVSSEQPGEQSQDPARKDQTTAPPVQEPRPAPQGSSNGPPEHWSAEDKAAFAKLPKEGQDFIVRRHQAMEADYQSKVQANASAVQFTQALAPIFEHPGIKASLANVEGRPLHPVHAIQQWAGFHLRAVSPDPNERAGLLREMAQRLRLDPAAVFGQTSQPPAGLSEQDMADPAIKYFADHVGRTMQEINSLKGELQRIQNDGNERQQQETLRVTRWGIDQFADEKDARGQPVHPHFDTVLPQMLELFRANPQRDLKEAYDTAVWMNPNLRQTLISQERQAVTQKQANERAALASRGNVRGRTSPVSKPTPESEGPKGLRATIAAAADEVGL